MTTDKATPMNVDIVWSSEEYHSIERCRVAVNANGVEVNGLIVGAYEGKIYDVQYSIGLNVLWQTQFIKVISAVEGQGKTTELASDGRGNWNSNGLPVTDLQGCIDVDIPLTPLTNTLPINRLQLADGEEREIKVVYADILRDDIRAVSQRYRRESKLKYHYENVPNDFEAKILVDEFGFVVDYPGLFSRTVIHVA
jgi:uncharacterized protein